MLRGDVWPGVGVSQLVDDKAATVFVVWFDVVRVGVVLVAVAGVGVALDEEFFVGVAVGY